MIFYLKLIWRWTLVLMQSPRAQKELWRLKKHHPELFEMTDLGDTGLSFYNGPMRLVVLARSMRTFEWTHGYWPDLIEPKSLTEKTFARKFILRMKAPIVEDKIKTSRFAELVGVSSPQIIATSKTPEGLLAALPEAGHVFVKLNRGSGTNCGVELPLSPEAKNQLVVRMKKWSSLRNRLLIGEWWNALIEPMYLAELSEVHESGQLLEDWKFFVLNGRVEFVQYDLDRFEEHRSLYLDREGNISPIWMRERLEAVPENDFVLPGAFSTMVKKAETFGVMFDQVRVDFYLRDDGTILLGELTIVPYSGVEPISPAEENNRLGSNYKLVHGEQIFDHTMANIE